MEIFTSYIRPITSAILEGEDRYQFNWFLREIKDEGMKILLELVEKGFDLRVVKSNGQSDLLQKYKEAQHF